jgi:hypothetical protein
MYGPLDTFSAFPFENYLSVLKRRIKKTRMIFQQSMNQIIHIRNLFTLTPNCENELSFTSASPNNCAVLPDGSILLVSHVAEDKSVCGVKLSFSRDLYTYPYSSSLLHIGYYAASRIRLSHVIPASKAICIPCASEYLIIPYA